MATKLYGAVNGQTKEVKKLYGALTTTTYEITNFADNPNVNYATFNAKYLDKFEKQIDGTPIRLQVATWGGGGNVLVRLKLNHDWGEETVTLFTYPEPYADQGAAWGFSQEPVQTDQITYTTTTTTSAKEITKLYGEVNGQTKLVYEKPTS